MLYECFTKQIQRLADVYSPKFYPTDRIDQIWKKHSSVDIKIFRAAVDALIADCPTAPLMPKINEYVLKTRKTLAYIDKDPHEHEKALLSNRMFLPENERCELCTSTGLISTYSKTGPSFYHYSYLCGNCRAGETAKMIPELSAVGPWKHQYELVLAIDDGDIDFQTKLQAHKHVRNIRDETEQLIECWRLFQIYWPDRINFLGSHIPKEIAESVTVNPSEYFEQSQRSKELNSIPVGDWDSVFKLLKRGRTI